VFYRDEEDGLRYFSDDVTQIEFINTAGPRCDTFEKISSRAVLTWHHTLTNHEMGAKGSLFDRRLRYDAAAYYIEWQDVLNRTLVNDLRYGGFTPSLRLQRWVSSILGGTPGTRCAFVRW
jgi:hypothetical protein